MVGLPPTEPDKMTTDLLQRHKVKIRVGFRTMPELPARSILFSTTVPIRGVAELLA